jgi:hypothetical protein
MSEERQGKVESVNSLNYEVTGGPCAWLVCLEGIPKDAPLFLDIKSSSRAIYSLVEGDAIIVAAREPLSVIAIGRVYRTRRSPHAFSLYFDKVVSISGPPISELGIPIPEERGALTRIDWLLLEATLQRVGIGSFNEMPLLTGLGASEQAYLRELLKLAVIDDLLGPADGPEEEILGMGVRDRYLVGKLAPRSASGDDAIEPPVASDEPLQEGVPADLSVYANADHIDRDTIPASVNDEGSDEDMESSGNHSLAPSSIGMTFCVAGEVETLEVSIEWGRYERQQSSFEDEKGKSRVCWKRVPSGGNVSVPLTAGKIAITTIDNNCPMVFLQGSVSEPISGEDRLVTLFLVNAQTAPEQNKDSAWIFQPQIKVRHSGGRPIFRRRPYSRSSQTDTEEIDKELEALDMIYRNRVEFAVGHGISVHATPDEANPEQATEIRTAVLPEYEVPVTETPGSEPEDRQAMRQMLIDGSLDMERLSQLDRGDLLRELNVLTDDYEEWIKENQSSEDHTLEQFHISAADAMERCLQILARLREGIHTLATNDQALSAFRFANQVMADQRIRSIYALGRRRGEEMSLEKLNQPKHRSWRPFQLAFVLLSIPALTDPAHRDRTQPLEAFADLLWFPTGGGKTEAYLGVAAFTMAIRRLQGNLGGFDSMRGIAVIMRYTLRLLTLQQFQRAATLICAMEVKRRAAPEIWGEEPFSIGLWVGQRVTPNTTQESHEAIEKERDGKYGSGATPAQLTTCPWCGSEIKAGRDIKVNKDIGRTYIYCGDKFGRCDFSSAQSASQGLPVCVVDDEIYRRPPSMLIATVDKFAMMAWRGQVGTLFGKASFECPRHGLLWPGADCSGIHKAKGPLPKTVGKSIKQLRPPDLIIQDEFHLISGPLGTMVGLYETAVDELSSWPLDGRVVRPKVIASTATVRKADKQVNNVFLRKVSVFPPHGIDVEDNFFSVQRSIGAKPGRRYVGICSPGSARPAVLIRVFVALLTGAKALFEHFDQAADPYMTVVGYFNSLRELGGMRRLAEDDVQTRSYRVQMSEVKRPGLSQRSVRNVDELTSRVSNKEIPKKLDQLEIKFKSSWEKGEPQAIDVVLATNMLSVGVDVNRLGLMVVNGQPKNTAEYIQATSRVGRAFPGLVCTVLTWSRPRDLSHYETFEHYHATFYKHVEAQSVTPYAPRALDRGLTGALVSLLRLDNENLNSNLGAQQLDSISRPEAVVAKQRISDRAWKAKDKSARILSESMIAERIDRWVKEAGKSGRRLGYESERGAGDVVALLKKPGTACWNEFTVPMSMREVEPGVQLVMDAIKHSGEPPAWKLKAKKFKGDPE